MAWFKTRKGRGYGKYDNKSHGTPHPMNSPEFWAVRKEFMARHGVEYAGVDEPAPADRGRARGAGAPQLRRGDGRAARRDRRGRSRISDRLVEVARLGAGPDRGLQPRRTAARRSSTTRASPTSRPTRRRCGRQPGEKAPNRAALATWGAWVNAYAHARSTAGRSSSPARPTWPSRPTSPASPRTSARLPGWGWYERDTNPRGALLPQEITEFTNAGVSVGIATVNLADDPMTAFNGFWARLLHLRLVLLPEVRADAPLQPARPGLRAQGRQGDLGGRPLGSRDGRGLAARTSASTRPASRSSSRRATSSTCTRGSTTRCRSCWPRRCDRCADRGAAPDPADGRYPRPRGAGHGLALRGGARRVPDPATSLPARRRPARSTCRPTRSRNPYSSERACRCACWHSSASVMVSARCSWMNRRTLSTAIRRRDNAGPRSPYARRPPSSALQPGETSRAA